jgi:hypothetical protein
LAAFKSPSVPAGLFRKLTRFSVATGSDHTLRSRTVSRASMRELVWKAIRSAKGVVKRPRGSVPAREAVG